MLTLDATLPARERLLLKRAADSPEYPALADLDQPALRDLAGGAGLDFATALLFDRVRRSPTHGPFIAHVQSLPATVPDASAEMTVAVVPGAFYKTRPRTGAGGRFLLDHFAACGVRAERVPLRPFGSLPENAAILRGWLRRRTGRRIVLVSLSKAGAEVKLALAAPDAAAAFRDVTAWVNLSGVLHGTPLVGRLLASRWRALLARLLFWCRGYSLAALRELERGPGRLLDAELRLPEHLKAIHVVGFPLRAHLSDGMAVRNYELLAALGPNDGGGILLADMCRLRGLVYPLWGRDHFLRPTGELRGLVCRLLHFIAGTPLPLSPASGERGWG